ncbi:MAG: VCBS repeat-containing protein [Actinobacteria bacterium]|nr:VCBS repeat-containing protein [Actinomycetota bacterium]
MDYDNDGDNDLLVSCTDHPYNGIYFFENTDGDIKMPIFKTAVRLAKGRRNIQPSYPGGKVRLLVPGEELVGFRKNNFSQTDKIYPVKNILPKTRANQWRYCDYDGDGDLDIIVGVGDWTDYGWDNAFNSKGEWTCGPLHGYVFLIKNIGSADSPQYAKPEKIQAGGQPIDVYGMPSPNFADYDNDGDLDLICGEFLDKFTYFENIGSRTAPEYAAGQFLTFQGKPIRMDLEMIVPIAFDWDKDGDVDLVVGQEDGRVAFVENTGQSSNGIPQFLPPMFFQQKANNLKFGALVTPYSFDWDGDGDADLICGNTAGYIGFIENLDGGNPPRWAAPKYLQADGKPIRIQAGSNGSIQGPCEAKWGYTTLTVGDWNNDGLADILANSIWGKVVWYKNIGTRKKPQLTAAQPVKVAWQGKTPKPAWFWWQPKDKELATQWRTTPYIIDLNKDGLNDLVMLDHEGYLAYFERAKKNNKRILLPGKRIFHTQGPSGSDSQQRLKDKTEGLLRLNTRSAGHSGRRKFCFTDWDGDGRIDLLVNSVNVNFLRNVSANDSEFVFQDMGKLGDLVLAGHTTSPTIVDWDKNGIPDLLVGAEDGHFYFLKNPRSKN